MLVRNVGGVLWNVHSPAHYELVGYPSIQIIYDGTKWREKNSCSRSRHFASVAEISAAIFGIFAENEVTVTPNQ